MSRYLKIASLALTACLAAGSARAIDPFFPTFGNSGIDVIHYGLDLKVTPATGGLDAKASLLVFAQSRLAKFRLDLHGLTVTSVRVNGVPATFARSGDKLEITPRWPIRRGAFFRVVIAYSGVPETIQDPTVPGDPVYQLGWFKYTDASYVVSEPVGASTFYPANDELTDKATFTTAITVPAGYIAAANGVLKSIRAIGTTKRFVWNMRQQMTTWLATVHINDEFTVSRTRTRHGIPVTVYATPTTPAVEVQNHLDAKRMIPYFERLIGRYPFESYAAAVVDDPDLYYALETQTISTFPHGEDDDIVIDAAFVAHELGHQWFGNSVSLRNWKDIWIAEGGATYLEVLWPNRSDPSAFKAAMEANYDYVVDEALGPAVITSPEDLFNETVYYRGAAVLYALQLKVGTRTYFRILRTFLATYRGGNASTEDFIRTAVRVSGKPGVRPFLYHWLYDATVPALPGYTAAATAERGQVARPDIVGARCGPVRHRGAPELCQHR